MVNAMLAVDGILETALYVADLQRAAGFYTRVFGFETLLESEKLIALNVAGRSVLLLFKQGATSAAAAVEGGTIPAHPGKAPTHFAFSIAASDVDAWKQHLAAQSVTVESTVDWPGGAESIYFRDPDNNLVELITPGFWRGF
jgi:catechol 2,3-dioxygenase-like lactoylglutathione lyase family enzyme